MTSPLPTRERLQSSALRCGLACDIIGQAIELCSLPGVYLSRSDSSISSIRQLADLLKPMALPLDLRSAHSQFTDYLSSRRRARATVVAYHKDIEQLVIFLENMGKKAVSDVSHDELEAFTKKLENDNYKAKSISRKINSIKTFFRFLKASDVLLIDPSAELEHPKYEVKPPRILSKLEYRALRDACRGDIRTYAIVELFLQTGIRIGELANLAAVDIKETELHIAAQEGHAERMVPLNKAGKEAVSRYLDIRGDGAPSTSIGSAQDKSSGQTKSQALFITKTGKSLLIRNIRTAIDRFFKVAGIEDAKVNDLRHTFIAHHLMAGTPITTLSKLVGHKRLSTTEKYLEFVKGQPAERVKLEEL